MNSTPICNHLSIDRLSYEYRAVNLLKGEQHSPEFKKLNPLGYVPVLVDGGVVVSDSYAIMLYLEEKYPERALLPADLRLKAVNLQIASVVSSSIQPLHMVGVLKHMEEKIGSKESRSWARSNIRKGLVALEKLLGNWSTKFATGEVVYMADVFLAPQLAMATTRFDIDLSKFPTLSRIYRSYNGLPEFIASSPEQQPDFIT